MDMDDFIKRVEGMIGGKFAGIEIKKVGRDHDDFIVVKSIPPKKDWAKRFKEMNEKRDEILKARDRLETMSKQLWAEIELALDDYSDMRWNQETGEIEVLAPKGGKPEESGEEGTTSFKSPFKIRQ